MTYLITCECGRKIAAEGVEAGRSLECCCGSSVAVPTLLALERLPTQGELVTPTARPFQFSLRAVMATLTGLSVLFALLNPVAVVTALVVLCLWSFAYAKMPRAAAYGSLAVLAGTIAITLVGAWLVDARDRSRRSVDSYRLLETARAAQRARELRP
jgi:hypothetical protein